jgi:alkylated DNA repair dioxygenase AlkB
MALVCVLYLYVDLFNQDTTINLLPYDGTVLYYGKVIPNGKADEYLHTLLTTIEWKHDEALIYGKHFVTPRKIAWYADSDFLYSYSGTTKKALPWTIELLQLKQLAEKQTGVTYNSCLLNLYHNGSEGMAWHSDGEKALRKNGSIASFSFGAERKFAFKHKTTDAVVSIILQHGSLLEMKDETQTHWLHRLPPTTKVKTPRVNLTFRSIV